MVVLDFVRLGCVVYFVLRCLCGFSGSAPVGFRSCWVLVWVCMQIVCGLMLTWVCECGLFVLRRVYMIV